MTNRYDDTRGGWDDPPKGCGCKLPFLVMIIMTLIGGLLWMKR